MRHARSPPQSQIPASQVLVSPAAGSKPLGLRGFLRARALALCTPPSEVEAPGTSMSPFQSPLPAHLIEGPVARGWAEGSQAEKPASACGAVLHGGTGSAQARLRGRARAHGGQRGGIPRPPREPAL